jgi:hypothetical protein
MQDFRPGAARGGEALLSVRGVTVRFGDACGGAECVFGPADGGAGVVDTGAGLGMAAAIGSVAEVLVAPIVFFDPDMMTGILIYGFAAALVGGIDNPGGVVIAGFVVGVLENLAGTYIIGNEIRLPFALVFIGMLLLKPAGLFGRVNGKRV